MTAVSFMVQPQPDACRALMPTPEPHPPGPPSRPMACHMPKGHEGMHSLDRRPGTLSRRWEGDARPMTAPVDRVSEPAAEGWEQRVEAAARAMHEVPAQPGVYGRIPWDRLIDQHRDAYRQMAAAALTAAAALQPSPAARVDAIDVQHLERQREWSRATFGPGDRAKGVVAHIRKELVEIEEDPADLGEWIDVAILALDGAWRAGHEPHEIIAAIKAKQARNEARVWPDWRTRSQDEAIEHDRSHDGVLAEALEQLHPGALR